jgi:hypothetical protein
MAAGNRFKPEVEQRPGNDMWMFIFTPLVIAGIVLMTAGIWCSRLARVGIMVCRQIFSSSR